MTPRVAAMVGERNIQYYVLMEQGVLSLYCKHYLWPLAVTMYTIWNTLLKPPASFYFFRTTFLDTRVQLRDQAHTLLYFLILRNICVRTICGTPSSYLINSTHNLSYHHIHRIAYIDGCVVEVFLSNFESQLAIHSSVKLWLNLPS